MTDKDKQQSYSCVSTQIWIIKNLPRIFLCCSDKLVMTTKQNFDQNDAVN